MSKKSFADSELVVFKNSQGLKARGTLLKLSQNHIVFEVYNPYSIVQLSEVLTDLTITRLEREIYSGKAIVTNIVNTGVILVVSASLSDSNWRELIRYYSVDDIHREADQLIESFESLQIVDEKIAVNIFAIRSFLSEVKSWFDKLEPYFEDKNNSALDDQVVLKYFPQFFEKLTLLFRKSSELISVIPRDKVEVYKKIIQTYLHPLLMSSPFPYRAYSKPLGFAGDYMMMYMIQNNSAVGPTLYSKFINVFYAHIPLSRSVNNRTSNLIRLIEGGVRNAEQNQKEFSSLSIGCGPALEVKNFIESRTSSVKCQFNLIDFNQETLDFAVNQAKSVIKDSSFEVKGELNSVHELLKKSVKEQDCLEKYDLVYCSGLFDYLSDRICSKLTRMFFEMLKPGGKVLVTNMHSRDRDRHIVEIVLDWYLIYRDEKNMASFAPDLGEQILYTDATGINLCLEITKI